MNDDRAKLLHSLSIDRGETRAAPPRRLWPWALVGGFAAGAAGVAFALMLGAPGFTGRPAEPAAAAEAAAPAAPVAPPPARARPAGLVASGYVVARRKATVAAEITGKVVEVMIEEGMVVEAGQVVARLDSTLADERPRAAAFAVERLRGGGRRDRRRPARRRAHPRPRAEPVAEELTPAEADLTKAEARVGVLRAQLAPGPGELRDRAGSTPSAAPRCSTSTASARRSAASWSTAAPSRAR